MNQSLSESTMSEASLSSPTDDGAADTPTAHQPVEQIILLMPVWGTQFVSRFLEFCLPTMLAPNNIPALARALPCRLLLLTSEAHAPMILSHPAWKRLEQVCEVLIQSIDDLITDGNHTATVTLAFERAVRQSGSAMRRTCFMFLMSDYLVADGSFKAVLTAIQDGANCVLAGNFQIVAEDAAPLLRQYSDAVSHEIVFPPRDLVKWSLAHLHPATVANIVNFGLIHNAHTNRLFWRVDENTLIGRFYLIHPIAIHPEVDDFVVGSSWDYSFVPELCPSGNTVTLVDSDDYLVVEMQRRDYEKENLRAGPIDSAMLAKGLAEWATEGHRHNVEQVVAFHAVDLPPNLPHFVEQSEAFLESIRRSLLTLPLSHRQHPYWAGSIAVNRMRRHGPVKKQDWLFLLYGNVPPNWVRAFGRHIRAKLFGYPPQVTPLHPWWPDYKAVGEALGKVFSSGGSVLLVAQNAQAFARWAVNAAGEVVTIETAHLLQLARYQYLPLTDSFDACLLVFNEDAFEKSDELVEHVIPLLKSDGRMFIMVMNNRVYGNGRELAQSVTVQAHRLAMQYAWLEDIRYTKLNGPRLYLRHLMSWLGAMRGVKRGFAILAAGPMALAVYLINLATQSTRTPPAGIWSSLCLRLRRSDRPVPLPLRFIREEGKRDEPSPPARPDVLPQRPAGTSVFGSAVNHAWHSDAAEGSPALASYRFIIDLIGQRNDVGEVGCANPLGTRLALQTFRKISLFDPRPFVIGDVQWYFRDEWRFEARVHNVLTETLSRKVDSVYSVDFIQYISRDEEDAFVRNLKDSLSRDSDFAVIGCPATVWQPAPGDLRAGAPAGSAAGAPHLAAKVEQKAPEHAIASDFDPSPLATATINRAGAGRAAETPMRIYRRTPEEMKALLERHFYNVFIFSMTDETVRAGIDSEAQHVFALGCGRKP